MLKKSKKKILIAVITALLLMAVSLYCVYIVTTMKYNFSALQNHQYKKFDNEVSLERSMNKFYDVKVPILKDTEFTVFEFRRAQYITDFKYTYRDIFFNQKKMRRQAIYSFNAYVSGIEYTVAMQIRADFYNDYYDKPTIISQVEEDIENYKNLEWKKITNIVAYQNTQYEIPININTISSPGTTREGVNIILQCVIDGLN